MSEWKETKYGRIANDWNFIPATEFCSRVTDGTHDSPKEQREGKPLITSKHIRGRNIDFESAYLISEEDFTKINLRSKVDQWDVIISMIGEYCGFCYVERNETIDYAVKNVGLFKAGTKTKALWLYYFLNSKIGRAIIEENKSGTSQPYLTLGFLRELQILIPSNESEQNKIVETISSLDDKTDLLNRQNKTLEELAETLFRHWFVEEAKEEWEIKSLDEIATYLNGLALQKFPSNGIDFLPVIKIKELNQGITENSDSCSRDIPPQYIIQDGDILFSWSGSLEVVIWHDGEGALNQHLFKVSSENYPKWLYYLATKYHLAEFRMIAESKSTTMGHIQREHLKQALISIPPTELFNQYNETLSPLIEKIIKNNAQIKTLTKQRDTLLPKLMSGEVTVSN